MKNAAALLIALLALACSPKKQETTTSTTADSLGTAVDTVLATTPAQPSLAFTSVDGWAVNARVSLTDSINYFLLGTQEQFDQKFARDKQVAEPVNPDFLINWVIGVATKSSNRKAHITLEKVETGDGSIDIYLTITRASPGQSMGSVSSVYAIERRDGFPVMQFYVNGKKDKSLVLVM
jgi:hypothetical protein